MSNTNAQIAPRHTIPGFFTLFATALLLCGIAAMPAQAATQSLTVTAAVESQSCINKDFVQVNLTAVAQSDTNPVVFRWDFTNDGVFDTKRSTNPSAIAILPDETLIVSKVKAINPAGEVARDKVRYTTIRCK